jgi:DNA-binding NtrC family response regulator
MLREEPQIGIPGVILPRGMAVVIDQNRTDLQAYTAALRKMGFEVTPFTSYQEALLRLEQVTPDFVFVDQGTVAFEARGFVANVLARNRYTPVVVLARSLHMGCYLEAMQLGAVDYVEKPLASAELEHLVTTHWQPRMAALRSTA